MNEEDETTANPLVRNAELDAAISIVERAGTGGRWPSDVALGALVDQCQAAWDLDDDAVALTVESAVTALRAALRRPEGERRAATMFAIDMLAEVMK